MKHDATTVKGYLDQLPDDRRKALAAVRKVIRANLPKGYKEGIQSGMIGYFVPHSIYPDGYHCDPKQPLPFASIASQKNHMAIYLFCIYTEPKLSDWFVKAWKKTGKKLDMGKSCVRFKKIEDVPLEAVGEALARVPVDAFIAHYETQIPASKRKSVTTKKAATRKKAASKKSATKKTVSKKSASKKISNQRASAKKPAPRKAQARTNRA